MPFSDWLARRRILLTRLLLVPMFAYVGLTTSPLNVQGYRGILYEALGYACLVVATLGRIWCLSYVGGYKDSAVVTLGPYSMVRNPLYIFNFLGAVGIGLAVVHPEVAIAIAIIFLFYYPLVVRREERFLEGRYGDAYRAYCARTPRWIPKFSLFEEPDTYTVRPRFIRRSLYGSMWFLWLFLIWEIIDGLRALGAIPVYSLG